MHASTHLKKCLEISSSISSVVSASVNTSISCCSLAALVAGIKLGGVAPLGRFFWVDADVKGVTGLEMVEDADDSGGV